MYELSVSGHFASSHFLRGYKGKCESLHGHTWKVEAVLSSGTLDSIGMVADFKDIKEKLNGILSRLDHAHLNDTEPFTEINPTTERLAEYIFGQLSAACRSLKVKQVTVWESDTASITYSKKEN